MSPILVCRRGALGALCVGAAMAGFARGPAAFGQDLPRTRPVIYAAQPPDMGPARLPNALRGEPAPSFSDLPAPQAPPSDVPAPTPREVISAPSPPGAATATQLRAAEPPHPSAASGAVAYDPCYCMSGPCYARYTPTRLDEFWHGHFKPKMQASHWGYHEYFSAPPLGAFMHGAFETQVANGQAAQLVLYRYDFCDSGFADGTQLNDRGRRRLHKMARLLAASPLPLMIECSMVSRELDDARRAAVYGELTGLLPKPISFERIVLVKPDDPGLSGVEAVEIHENMLQQTGRAASAPPIPTGFGF